MIFQCEHCFSSQLVSKDLCDKAVDERDGKDRQDLRDLRSIINHT